MFIAFERMERRKGVFLFWGVAVCQKVANANFYADYANKIDDKRTLVSSSNGASNKQILARNDEA